MKNFLKTILAVFIGISLFIVAFFGIIFIFASMAGAEKKADIASNSILYLDLNYSIPEKTTTQGIDYMDLNALGDKQIGLNDIIASIQQAKSDDKIKGIYIKEGAYANGMATTEAIRDALIDFKKSGKFIYSYGDMYSQKGYYLASVADKIYLNPKGFIELMGFGTKQYYLKGLLDKLGIEVQAFHRGKFKSAFDPLVRTDMSEANRQQITELLTDIYNHFLDEVSTARKIDRATLNIYIDSAMIQNPAQAKKYGIITDVKYYDQVLGELATKLNLSKNDKVSFTPLKDYITSLKKEGGADKIAIVFAQGNIVDGLGDEKNIGGDNYAKIFKKLRENKNVKAIVIRINSGGGSALASEIMWREISLTKAVKPVIVSFGDVAASGGYYMACNSDRIFAQPNTITGSIGVFGLIPNGQKLLNEKLGVTTDEVRITKHGVQNIGVKPLDDFESRYIQNSIDSTYETFLTRVANGRKQTFAQIEDKAEGRVWSGVQAIKIGLVDEIGSLDDAIAYAAKKANIKKPNVVNYPQDKELIDKLLENMEEKNEVKMIETKFGKEYAQIYLQFLSVKSMIGTHNIQTRMPYDLIIE
ncbi:MAG: signal peptide peptidase SppA [Bacteroidota bacterium]